MTSRRLPGSGIGWDRKRVVAKRQEQMFGSDGYVHCLDCGDGFMGVEYVQMYQTSNMCGSLLVKPQ